MHFDFSSLDCKDKRLICLQVFKLAIIAGLTYVDGGGRFQGETSRQKNVCSSRMRVLLHRPVRLRLGESCDNLFVRRPLQTYAKIHSVASSE